MHSTGHQITGSRASDIIRAGAGADTLDGDGGGDTLAGGAGNDTYIVKRGMGLDTLIDGAGSVGDGNNHCIARNSRRVAQAAPPLAPAAAPPKSPRSEPARARMLSRMVSRTSADVNTSHSACGLFTFTQSRGADTLLPKACMTHKRRWRLAANVRVTPCTWPKRRSGSASCSTTLRREWLAPTILGHRHEPTARNWLCTDAYAQASSNCGIKRHAGCFNGGASSRVPNAPATDSRLD